MECKKPFKKRPDGRQGAVGVSKTNLTSHCEQAVVTYICIAYFCAQCNKSVSSYTNLNHKGNLAFVWRVRCNCYKYGSLTTCLKVYLQVSKLNFSVRVAKYAIKEVETSAAPARGRSIVFIFMVETAFFRNEIIFSLRELCLAKTRFHSTYTILRENSPRANWPSFFLN